MIGFLHHRTPTLAGCLYFTALLLSTGCAQSYVTPGAGVSLTSLANADDDIQERMQREPTAAFPARVAIVRVQAPGYRSYRNECYGDGRYSVVTTRDVETDEDFARIRNLPNLAGLAPLNRMVIPATLQTDKELRLAAASLKTDMLLVYTIDTKFRIDEHDIGPLRMISLGMLPTKEACVTATASLAIFDVRTGYVYGLAEATAREKRIASSWTRRDAVEDARIRAERQAFAQLVVEFDATWKGIVREYSANAADRG